MKIAILSTGDELMQGLIVNTNEQWLSEKCRKLGHEVLARATVRDDLAEIGEALSWLSAKADVILVSGGLGPTADDITLEAAAKAFNTKLVFHPEVMEKIKERFQKSKREMTSSNERQAWLPEGSVPLPNHQGTAPGVHWQISGKDFFFFPGVPSELYFIFENSLQPWLQQKAEYAIYEKVLRCFGMPEATVDTKLQGLDLKGARLSYRAKFPEVLLKLSLKGEQKSAETVLQTVLDEMKTRLGEAVYDEGETDMAELIIQLLGERKETLSVAESCTGGFLSHFITNVSGAGEWFIQGNVTYDNQAKERDLNVPMKLIEKHGAVSREVALEMVRGMQKRAGTTWALSLTGLAGPTQGDETKPVGTLYIGLKGPQVEEVHEFFFLREREEFKKIASWTALNLLRSHLS